ncbi:sensor histidine kinase [uncultured Litoreibacter sp.]|uniref:sensor histidine kinase n=1 Tax=uncultured Litoreibacter sp. TaxID=1392394 RepID=UPI00260745AA|nr:sensor histidine kinase [uncultured Litoreibacter sp.]
MPNPDEALACFLSIAQAIAGPTDYEQVLTNFADGLRTLIPHDHLDIVLLHPSGTQICYEAQLQTKWNHTENPYRPTENSPIRDVLRGEVDSILTEDAWVDPRFHFEGADSKPLFEANLHSRIIVPLRVQGAITGSLAISSHQIGVYQSDLVVTAQGAADLVAAYLFALERGKEARDAAVAESDARGREAALRLGALRLTEGMERERQRLGMDLHDQTLADLARIKRRMARLQDGDTAELSELDAALENCLADLRGIVEDMKPGVLQLFGFADAVEAHLQRCVIHYRRRIETTVNDSTGGQVDALSDTIRTAVYRIVQEAINNALKHGNATRLSVEVLQKCDALHVRVDDNGPGIDLSALTSDNGLENIRTRAELISANVAISNASPLGGARIEISLTNA